VGQVEDNTTGLSYLNARYYDTTTGLFTAPDPVLDVHNIKSLNPYTYSSDSPATLSDPAGTTASYTFGLELQNKALRGQVSDLLGHIDKLNVSIGKLQNIIKEQQNQITKLVAHIRSLEAAIRQQQTAINKLQARVRYLAGRVQYWRGRAMYYRGVAMQLVDLAYLPAFRGQVKASIEAGNGLPNLWLGTYAARSMSLHAQNDLLVGGFRAAAPGAYDAMIGSNFSREQLSYFVAWGDYEDERIQIQVGQLRHDVAQLEEKIDELTKGDPWYQVHCDELAYAQWFETWADVLTDDGADDVLDRAEFAMNIAATTCVFG
jgi:RHS repeat-associated protein